VIELFHGYTYSAHPLACAAGLATLDTHEELDLAARTAAIAPEWEAAAHALKGERHVADVSDAIRATRWCCRRRLSSANRRSFRSSRPSGRLFLGLNRFPSGPRSALAFAGGSDSHARSSAQPALHPHPAPACRKPLAARCVAA
jgi:DNA-directed RNA polymerase subunit N (RpoN/RPB10)